MASNNMYRVGGMSESTVLEDHMDSSSGHIYAQTITPHHHNDFVYFESSATAPYQIRRIDELNKTPTGAVEAKVACYYRRRDVSSALINQAERYYVDDDSDEDFSEGSPQNDNELKDSSAKRSNPSVSELQRHQLKHRELFLSRQVECLPATHIRGKCSVTLYNDAEPLTNYLSREEAFYYKLIYDPSLKTLQEDRGSMRIGSDHQSEIQPLLSSKKEDPRMTEVHEELVWNPSNPLNDQDVNMFCLLARAIGTLARAHDPASAVKQPLLLTAAAAAGRDITKQHAHDLLHEANYDLAKALNLLMPGGQPVLYRDQLEDWSASEANLFEEALDKYSKTFTDIMSDYLPWKTHKSLVELYYFWKTTDRYVRQRRAKLAAQEHKLKQVYIPNYSKPNPAVLYNGSDKNGRGCEGCGASSSPQWYAWGPTNLLCRLCASCWSYWKRYGGLKNPETKGSAISSLAGGRPCPGQRTQERSIALRNPSNQSLENDSKSGGPINITGSINHQFRSHSIGIPASSSDQEDNKSDNGSSTNNSTNKSAVRTRPNMAFGILATPRGTNCCRTVPIIRLARIMCPEIVRPLRLARRPGRQAKSTGNHSTDSVLDTESSETSMTIFTELKNAALPRIAQLSNPLTLLTRTRKMPLLCDVIDRLAARKGLILKPSSLLSGSKVVSQPNGPVTTSTTTTTTTGRKRPHSGSDDKPEHEKLNGNKSKADLKDNIESANRLSNGNTPPSIRSEDPIIDARGDNENSPSPPPAKKQATAILSDSSPVSTTNGLSNTDGVDISNNGKTEST